MNLHDHNLVTTQFKTIKYEQRPAKRADGSVAEGLFNTWIILNNEKELNSYTTDTVKEVILAFRQASNDRSTVAVVFTGAGNRAFCTGGNTREYAEYYAGQPQEYRQYMRLFNDMVSAILACDKPVICRANGMRIGGGQEIGMACDYTIAQDMARFGQAGPKHGSAPDGGATDFLHLYVGIENSLYSNTACDPWSAHKAMRLGLVTEIVPALKVDDKWVANPLVVTEKWVNEEGQIVFGEAKTGDDLAKGKALLSKGTVDLSRLDAAVEKLCTKLMMTFPDCLTRTIESVRKKKLEHWDKNKEGSRAWLALNMMTEARAGFRAFHYGEKEREVDFVKMRQRLAQGMPWNDEMYEAISPPGAKPSDLAKRAGK